MATTDYPLTPLGQLFKSALERSGLYQSDVTARAGTSASNWNTVLYGGRELRGQFYPVIKNSPELIAKFAFVLGVDIEKALALRGYTLDQVKGITYDLSNVPLKQLQAELRKREKAKAKASQDDLDREEFDDEFQAAVQAVDRGEPQPKASRKPRHAGAEKATGT